MLLFQRRWKPMANSQRASSADTFAPMSEDFYTVSSIRTYYLFITQKILRYILYLVTDSIYSAWHVFKDSRMLVKSSILVHANSTVSLSPLLSCATLNLSLPAYLPFACFSFDFERFTVPPCRLAFGIVLNFCPPLRRLICSRSARALRTFVSNAGLCHSLSKSIGSRLLILPLALLDFDPADFTCVSTGFHTLTI